jgi:predicted neutral ceramidase superfamily lipid hydrolase
MAKGVMRGGASMMEDPIYIVIFIVIFILLIVFIYYVYIWAVSQKVKVVDVSGNKVKPVVMGAMATPSAVKETVKEPFMNIFKSMKM